MRRALSRSSLLTACFLTVLVLAVLVPASPSFQEYPSGDSGIFLYTGWRVTQGALPYRDVWDHKAPLIYVIDAVGLAVSGSRWGVWGVEVVSLWIAALLAFRVFQRTFGTLTAVYASVAWLVNAFLTMDGGNYTTEYALPFQFALLLVFVSTPQSVPSARRAFVLGILSGLLFWLKQNDIGIPLAIVLFLVLMCLQQAHRRASLVALGAMSAGVLLVSAIVILPFVLQRALLEFWDAVFLFNFVYIEETWLDRLIVLRFLPVFLPAIGLAVFAVVGWLVAALTFANGVWARRNLRGLDVAVFESLGGDFTAGVTKSFPPARRVRLLALCVLAFPIELVLVSISGNRFDHYYLALLPVLSVLAAFTFEGVLEWVARIRPTRGWVTVFTAVFVVVLVLFAAEPIQTRLQLLNARRAPALADTILRLTEPSDQVFIWGWNAFALVETQRQTPTRFIYVTPLVRRGYAQEAKAFELLHALLTQPPRLIVAQNLPGAPLFHFPITSARVDAAVAQIRADYELTTTIEGFEIYEKRTR